MLYLGLFMIVISLSNQMRTKNEGLLCLQDIKVLASAFFFLVEYAQFVHRVYCNRIIIKNAPVSRIQQSYNVQAETGEVWLLVRCVVQSELWVDESF